ncbi:MAG TPA: class I SAM-dependent methyltransferase [Rhizomicrobium sp.]|nr:class I SAM-dependent methyltransferase [Rhizomicrobium sp.]
MRVRTYQSLPYRALAVASHITSRDVWPYYADRIGRRISGRRLRFFSQEQTEAVYGPYAHDLVSAFRAVGLNILIHDPRAVYPLAFEQSRKQIDGLGIPFQQLGLAGSSDLRLAYSAAIGTGAQDILETGVALGWSSLAFLKAIERTGGRLVSVDRPYPFLIGQSWVGAAVPSDMRAHWTLLRHSDRRGIPQALHLSDGYDLIHYDSDKTQEGRNWAYPRLWRALRPGGLLISDDVGDNESWMAFCRANGVPPVVVRRRRAFSGLARKPVTAEPALLSA